MANKNPLMIAQTKCFSQIYVQYSEIFFSSENQVQESFWAYERGYNQGICGRCCEVRARGCFVNKIKSTLLEKWTSHWFYFAKTQVEWCYCIFFKCILCYRSIEGVQSETLEHFRSSAKELIAERGAEDALAAALALISGSTKITSRSMLSSKEVGCCYKQLLLVPIWEIPLSVTKNFKYSILLIICC